MLRSAARSVCLIRPARRLTGSAGDPLELGPDLADVEQRRPAIHDLAVGRRSGRATAPSGRRCGTASRRPPCSDLAAAACACSRSRRGCSRRPSGPSCASCSSSSVVGPQNWLVQYTGVANSTSAARPGLIASAIVVWCSSGSGTFAPSCARESIASGETPVEAIVRFFDAMARCPGAGSAGLLGNVERIGQVDRLAAGRERELCLPLAGRRERDVAQLVDASRLGRRSERGLLSRPGSQARVRRWRCPRWGRRRSALTSETGIAPAGEELDALIAWSRTRRHPRVAERRRTGRVLATSRAKCRLCLARLSLPSPLPGRARGREEEHGTHEECGVSSSPCSRIR